MKFVSGVAASLASLACRLSLLFSGGKMTFCLGKVDFGASSWPLLESDVYEVSLGLSVFFCPNIGERPESMLIGK